jgi:hypothetical protein
VGLLQLQRLSAYRIGGTATRRFRRPVSAPVADAPKRRKTTILPPYPPHPSPCACHAFTVTYGVWRVGTAVWGAKAIVAEHPALAVPPARIRGHGEVVDESTDIVMGAFVRSGLSVAVAAFRLAQEPRAVRIAHHTGSPSTLIDGIRHGVPSLLLVRGSERRSAELRDQEPRHIARRGLTRVCAIPPAAARSSKRASWSEHSSRPPVTSHPSFATSPKDYRPHSLGTHGINLNSNERTGVDWDIRYNALEGDGGTGDDRLSGQGGREPVAHSERTFAFFLDGQLRRDQGRLGQNDRGGPSRRQGPPGARGVATRFGWPER